MQFPMNLSAPQDTKKIWLVTLTNFNRKQLLCVNNKQFIWNVICCLQSPSKVASDLVYLCRNPAPTHSLSPRATMGKAHFWPDPSTHWELNAISGFKHIHCIQTWILLTNRFPWFQGWWASLFTKKKRSDSCKSLSFFLTILLVLSPTESDSSGERENESCRASMEICHFFLNSVLFMKTSPAIRWEKRRPKCSFHWNKLQNLTDARIPSWFPRIENVLKKRFILQQRLTMKYQNYLKPWQENGVLEPGI